MRGFISLAFLIHMCLAQDPAVFQFRSGEYRVSESVFNAVVVIDNVGNITESGTLSVNVADGTAVSGEDYDPTAGLRVSFSSGDASKEVTILIVDDAAIEGDETFQLSLRLLGPSRPSATIGSVGSATVVIIDNDVPPNIRWTLPPLRGPVAAGDTKIRTTTQWFAQDSSELHLKWEFTLGGGAVLHEVTWESNTQLIGRKTASGEVTVSNLVKNNFNISLSDPATLIVYNVKAADEETFTCGVESKASGEWKDNIKVRTYVPPMIGNVAGEKTVREGKNLLLTCNVSGKPTPNITWTKEELEHQRNTGVLQEGALLNITKISRNDSGKFACRANNGFLSPASQSVYVTVSYPPKIINFLVEYFVREGESVTLNCEADGNPPPTYSWAPCDLDQVCDKNTLEISRAVDDANFSCKAANELSNDTENTSVFIAGEWINVTIVIISESCNGSFWSKRLNEVFEEVFAGKLGYERMRVKKVSCGTITVDLALKFNSTTKEIDVLTILREAAKDGKLGEFAVSLIERTRLLRETTTKGPTTTPRGSSNTVAIVGGSVGGAVVCCGAVAAIFSYKKKQNEKKEKGKNKRGGHTNGGQERRDGDEEAGNDNNYAVEGPGANCPRKGGNVGNEQGIPEYAVVDKVKILDNIHLKVLKKGS